MPHYKDGTLAKVGDIVKGKGYNVTGEDGQLKEIVGKIVSITPGETCNVKVAYIDTKELQEFPNTRLCSINPGISVITDTPASYLFFWADLEYGQADHFEKIL